MSKPNLSRDIRQRLRMEAVEHITSELELSLRIFVLFEVLTFWEALVHKMHSLSRFLYPDNKEIPDSNVLAET